MQQLAVSDRAIDLILITYGVLMGHCWFPQLKGFFGTQVARVTLPQPSTCTNLHSYPTMQSMVQTSAQRRKSNVYI